MIFSIGTTEYGPVLQTDTHQCFHQSLHTNIYNGCNLGSASCVKKKKKKRLASYSGYLDRVVRHLCTIRMYMCVCIHVDTYVQVQTQALNIQDPIYVS